MKETFTLQTPLRNLIAHRRVAPLLPGDVLNSVTQDDLALSLQEWLDKGKTSFDASSLQQFLWAANLFATLDEEGDENSMLLWETPPLYKPESMGRPYLDLYLLDHPAPVVVVVPGGGYAMTAIAHEGEEIAKAYNAQGFHAVMVRYRVKPNYYPVPQMDLIRAIKMVRANAEAWQIESDHLAVCGFSAGGHLTASIGGLYDTVKIPDDEFAHISAKPNALVLSYAVISFSTFAHTGSADSLLGPNNTAALREQMSCEKMVNADYPPSFIWTCGTDETVPIENSQMMAAACETAGVPYELNIYPGGAHGVGLGIGLAAEPWLGQSAEFLKKIFADS